MKSFVNVKDVGTSYRALNNSFIINLAAGKRVRNSCLVGCVRFGECSSRTWTCNGVRAMMVIKFEKDKFSFCSCLALLNPIRRKPNV